MINTLYSPSHPLPLPRRGILHPPTPRPPRQPGYRTLHTGERREV